MLAIRIHATGGPEALRVDDIPVPAPAAGEVRIQVEAAGLNFIDTYQRSGLYAVPLPFTLGAEIAGIVSAVGAGVTEFTPGDRVATAKASGGYAAEALAPAAHVVKIPAGVTTSTAAALMLQGLTAHYLVTDTFALKPGDSALIHAAAGGVGLLLVQLAKRRGARVIATVGTEEKVALARVNLGDLFFVSGEGLIDLREAHGGVATEQERNDAHNDAADRQHAVIFARNGIHGDEVKF